MSTIAPQVAGIARRSSPIAIMPRDRSRRDPDPAPGPALGDPRPGARGRRRSATRSSTSRPRSPAATSSSRRHRRSAGDLRRRAPGRRPARLLRRAGLDPDLQRPAVLDCRDDFLGTIPALAERLRPAGRREAALPPLLGRRKPARARASTAPRRPPSRATAGSTSTSSSATRTKPNSFGIDQDFLDSLAGSIGELERAEWHEYLEDEGGSDGRDHEDAQGLRGARPRPRHPHRPGGDRHRARGTRTLQDGPSLAQIERAIEAVS